jgi:hypothetical protein
MASALHLKANSSGAWARRTLQQLCAQLGQLGSLQPKVVLCGLVLLRPGNLRLQVLDALQYAWHLWQLKGGESLKMTGQNYII